MEIVEINEFSNQALMALNKLMPLLSSSFSSLSKEDLSSIIESDASTLLMAKEDNQFCGAITLVMFQIPSGSRAWIEDVVVSEEVRGKGVGKKLVQHAVNLALEARVKSIDLTARDARGAAIYLYKKVGFQDRETNVFRYNGK